MDLEVSDDKFLKITYSVLGTAFVVMFGFAAWITSVEINADTLGDNVKKIEIKQDEVQNILQSIDKRLSRIEVLLERINKED